MQQTRTYCDGGINWNWYVQGQFNDQDMTVHILFYDRWHKFETPKHPKTTGLGAKMLEDDKRNVYGLRVYNHDGSTVDYLVINAANVFSYRDFSQLVLED